MRVLRTPAGEVRSLRFAPDGQMLYALSTRPWVGPNSIEALVQHASCFESVSGMMRQEWVLSPSEVAIYSPDLGAVFYQPRPEPYSWEIDYQFRRLQLDTGEERGVPVAPHPRAGAAAMSPDGRILATSCNGTVSRFDLHRGVELEPIGVEARCLAYSLNGRLLATGGPERVAVWDGWRPIIFWASDAHAVAWSPNGRLAWVGEQAVTIADVSNSEVRTAGVPRGRCSALTFSACGRFVAVGTDRGTCSFHDASNGSARATFEWGIGAIHSIAFAPDGLTCAAGGANGQVVVWDVDG